MSRFLRCNRIPVFNLQRNASKDWHSVLGVRKTASMKGKNGQVGFGGQTEGLFVISYDISVFIWYCMTYHMLIQWVA